MKFRFTKRFFKPLGRPFKNRVIKPIRLYLQYELAKGYRYVLDIFGKVCFIGGPSNVTSLVAPAIKKTTW